MTPASTDSPGLPRRYSPFWALSLIFLTLIVFQGSFVLDDLKQYRQAAQQRDQIQNARDRLKGPLAQAQTLNQTTEALSRELLALSSNSVEAASIIAEFKIQVNNPPPGR